MKEKKINLNPYNACFPRKEEDGPLAERKDTFYWLGEMNKASLIINSEEGLLDKKFVPSFAKGLQKVIDKGNSGGPRPQNVVAFEPYWIQEAGPEVSRIHAGRSSQDMLTTVFMIMTRKELLALSESLSGVMETLLAMAEKHKETIVPAYTNGVAAQPTSYGHYLHAFIEGFSRDMERVQQFYRHVNRSAMGSTVLNGTGWPLNRDRMARYLGFPEIAYNCYDATQIYTLEYSGEAAGVCTTIALHISNFIADLMQQYAQPRPWILLQEGGSNTYVSSAMPQKRNPGIINNVRTMASTLLGECSSAIYRGHNIPTGMADTRGAVLTQLLRDATYMTDLFNYVLGALHVDSKRSLEELNLDWTASQEVADVLMRKYNVPFRIGHHVASEMVSYARKNDILPGDFPHERMADIYRMAVQESGLDDVPAELPMSQKEFEEALDPVHIVRNRAVKGGPQPAELEKMFAAANKKIAGFVAWREDQITKLREAREELDQDFKKLL